jgi:hypothetical protein
LARTPAAPQALPAADLLEKILEKTEIYCRRLGKVSLHFVCRERIDERQFDPPRQIAGVTWSTPLRRVTSVSLEYDYQLIRKGEAIEEKRTLLMEDKRPRNEPDAVLKTRLYKHKYLVFPVRLWQFWQPALLRLPREETSRAKRPMLSKPRRRGPRSPISSTEKPGSVKRISPSSRSNGTSAAWGTTT